MLHKRPTIDSFHLNLIFSQGINIDQYISKDARVWLQFATDREVKHLFFASKRLDSLSPHCCVFTSQSLVTLELYGCMHEEYRQQSQPHHMGSLRKLRLVDVKGTDEAFDQLISACSSLQELDIYWPFGLWTITSPTVRRLTLEMRVYRRLKLNCPLLKRLEIGIFGDSPSFVLSAFDVSSLEVVKVARLLEGLSHIKAFLKEFRDVKLFSLLSQAFEQLCRSEKMDFPQNTWHCLALHPRWDHERCLEIIIELLKSSVKLDVLIIDSGQSSGELEVLSSEFPSSSCVIPLLKNVSISVCSKYYEVQLQVVEFILKSAVVLEGLLITSEDDQLTVFEMLEFLKEVSRFKRASVNAFVDLYRKS